MIKILPCINIARPIYIWLIIIIIIKICNVICGFIYYKKLVFPHTVANKITGFILFIIPLIIGITNLVTFEIIICIIATFSAIQEGHYIRTKKI